MQTDKALAVVVPGVDIPTGQFRTFGPFGPNYEVGSRVVQLTCGEWMVQVTLVENSETFDYRLRDLLLDAKE